jgi:hypothetical protein
MGALLHPVAQMSSLAPLAASVAAIYQAAPTGIGGSPSITPVGSAGLTATQAMALASAGAFAAASQLAGPRPRSYDRQLSRDSSSGLPPVWEEGSLAAATALFGGAVGFGTAATGGLGGSRAVAAGGMAPPAAVPSTGQREASPDVQRRSSSDSEAGGQRREERRDRAFGQSLFLNPEPGALNPESPQDPLPSIPMWEFDNFGRVGSVTNALSLTGNLDVTGGGGSMPGFSPRGRASSVPRGMSPDGPALSWNGARHMAGSTYGPPGMP